jgi:hypothetical protein
MSELASPVGDAIRDLETSARERGVEVHRSFFVELENYARHEGVRELPPRDLQRALVGIGEGALGHGGSVGGGAVRQRIAELCNDPFSACDLAARRILGETVGEPAGGAHGGGGGSGRISRIMRELPDDPFSVR